MVAISEDMVQSMWYRALTDSIARMEAPVDIEGLFVGSFSSVAEALDEDQEKILPTGILNIRLYDMKTRQVVWRTTLRDREIFPATMDLNASIPPLVSQAIEALKEQYELYPKVIDGL
jgi:hypothetical protein